MNSTSSFFSDFAEDFFKSFSEGILIIDRAQKVLLMNDMFQELWSVPASSTNAATILTTVADQVEKPAVFHKRVEEIRLDHSCESEEIIKLKNGQIYQRNTRPLILKGKNSGRYWVYRDVTQEFRSKQALKESKDNYQILHRKACRYIQEFALLNRVRAALKEDLELPSLIQVLITSITETFGYSPIGFYLLKDGVLRSVHHLGHEDVVEEIPIHLGITGRVARTGKPVLVEDVRTDPDFIGSVNKIASEISVPIFDSKGVIGVLNVDSIDGTKLTQADLNIISMLCEQVSGAINQARLYSELKISEHQWQNVFDLAPIGFILCEIDGTFFQVNKAFENTIGYSMEELKGMNFIDITHPEEVESNSNWMEQIVRGEISTYNFEKRYVHKNGSSVSVLLQISLLPTQAGQPARLIAQAVDLTHLRKAENALLQHQKTESIGVLASGIAHDFNNLLVVIKLQSSMALMKLPAGSEAKAHLDQVNIAAESAASLTNQLMAYAGRGQFKIEQTDLNAEILRKSRLLEVAIPKQIQLKHHLAPNLPKVMTDNAQLQQILMNLIINGKEAIGDNVGSITISTEEVYLTLEEMNSADFILTQSAPGPFVAISIEDNGSGVELATLRKIFDPFFTTKFTGRGLGLAAVLGIVRRHNGLLFITSEVHIGTMFKIYFPIAANQEEHILENSSNEQMDSPKKDQKASLTDLVLFIDDDKYVREAVIDLLHFERIPMIYAKHGVEGIAQLKSNKDHVKLIILDLSMPGISSAEAFSELRKINPHLPILLCSGFSELKVGDDFSRVDYSGFIAKPFEPHKFIKIIRSFLD